MKRRLCIGVMVVLLCVTAACALAEGAQYTGVASKEMTVRQEKSKSAKKAESVSQYETLTILELDEEWVKIEKNGKTGYVLGANVYNVTAEDGSEVPAPYDTRLMEVPIQPDGETVLYTGVATTDLTVRETKSKSGKKLERVKKGEIVDILELNSKEWFTVRKDGQVGYILAKYVTDLKVALDGVEIPAQFEDKVILEFTQLYTATVKVNLSMRKDKDRNSRSIGTLYEDEIVSVGTVEGDWAMVKKGKTIGYVLLEHLKQFKATDPYAALIPGAEFYPYAATVLREVTIYDVDSGEALQVLTPGAVICVREQNEAGNYTLPYKRVQAEIRWEDADAVSLETIKRWDQCAPGELLSVFSTYYDTMEESEILQGRRFNMLEGVRRIGGAVIDAGGRFSFNGLAGPYTKGNGYMKGPIINYTSSEKTGYGGGICQVSTTLYNAILQIPIKITRAQPHSSVGIDYAPIDFDEAVGAGNIDLVFENYLDYSIRLDLQMTEGVVTVKIYREA